ncbi:MAG: hypothetical protein WCT12_27855 [Verrucomicrobiota bacterium]
MLGAAAPLLTEGEEIVSHDLFARWNSKKTITEQFSEGDEEFVGKVIRLLEDGSLPKATAKKVAASLKKPENLPQLLRR